MTETNALLTDEEMPRARLALLLKHFSQIDDDREAWRVMYPLSEGLLLLTCATISSCDDFEDIVAWGEDHLDFLKKFSPFYFGIPCQRWLRTLVNRVDPVLFARCFEDWIKALWPSRHDLTPDGGCQAHKTCIYKNGLISGISVYTFIPMIIWDETKRAVNLAKHGVDFADVAAFEWGTAMTELDDRADYQEARFVSLGFIGQRLHVMIWTNRDGGQRIISLRKANPRETRRYVRHI
ncbi:conserved hypothetical protein [uncultured Gammaproteobacteria bacterium]